MDMEKTYIMIKPDAVQRGLIGEIISRFEKKGLQIIALKMIQVTPEKAKELYDVHVDKPFYESLENFVISGPIVAMVIQGPGAVSIVRKLLGATKSYEAEPGTIRGDYGMIIQNNLVHGSDAVDRAKYEMSILFKEDEILDYEYTLHNWILE